MTLPENGKPLWDESRVESLLEQFFQREIPVALRGPNPSRLERSQLAALSSPEGTESRGTNSRANSKTGGLMVGFTLLLMLMVVMVVWNPSPQDSPNPRSSTGGQSAETSDSEPDEGDDDVSDALRHKGDGPIELRPRIHSVGTDDPAPKKSPFPETEVEVFPIDGESPKAQGKPRKPADHDTPMPEEGRTLPESQPQENDPDEARLEPMLPELRAIFPASELE